MSADHGTAVESAREERVLERIALMRKVYRKPIVVAGFEPLDILASVHMLLTQIRGGRCEVENQYSRVVREEGDPQALALMAEVFELRPHFECRGLGFISSSALKLNAPWPGGPP